MEQPTPSKLLIMRSRSAIVPPCFPREALALSEALLPQGTEHTQTNTGARRDVHSTGGSVHGSSRVLKLEQVDEGKAAVIPNAMRQNFICSSDRKREAV
uniref:Uncharacterized protein n=1 Tax=Knipowitschia caucasica TaxID=637954 RepID=A0AAV2M0R6_KNICA